ncbi:MAG: sigma-70 family RNA polymerase sigma factor [Bryobacterales bacterium]|nr:sigma-70 family RNA polymerase sigma factor [Bryobacteraceae bacterium]MDW8353847.1 sigma-70 family RNA polymerase sigma factor [Bryobacterales bacterium]
MPSQPAAAGHDALALFEDEAVDRFLREPSEESYGQLFRALAPRLLCYFRTRGCPTELAEDLAQEVMWTVYQRSWMLRRLERFRPWLYKVMRNVLLQHLRRSRRDVATVALGKETAELPAPVADPLAGSQFSEWMASLAPDEREILTLRYVDELEYHEIAEVLGLPTGTVQWKIFNAKKKLIKRFGNGRG